jgi:hypothetical protein
MSIVRVPFSLTGGSAGGYVPAGAVWLDGSADYFSWTPSSGSSNTDFTFSFWAKRSGLTAFGAVLAGITTAAQSDFIRFSSNDAMETIGDDGNDWSVKTSALYRDTTAWQHWVISFNDTTDVRMWKDGVEITDFATNTESGTMGGWLRATAQYVGRNGAGQYYEGYLAEVIALDGTNVTDASDFGELDSNGVWIPKDPSGLTFGSNGFWLDFADSADLGGDNSGNGNDFTLNSITSANATNDNPMDNEDKSNRATLNPLSQGGGTTSSNRTFSNGNRTLSTSSAAHGRALSTIPFPTAGKVYIEFPLTTAALQGFGVCSDDTSHTATPGFGGADDYGLYDSGSLTRIYNNSSQLGGSLTPRFDTGSTDIGQIVYDGASGKLWFGVNDTWFDSSGGTTGNPSTESNATYTLSTSKIWFAYANSYNSAVLDFDVDFDDHTYTVTGSVELATQNLPAPTITDPSAYFQTTLYTGNATASRDITQTGNSTFQPDLVIIKNRDQADEWKWVDAVRGVTKELNSDSTNAESTDANGVTAFNADGFELGTGAGGYNDNTENFVAYQLKAGGSGSSNTDGSITSTVNVADHSGFSIGTYTGVGSTGTVGHGLGQTPDMIINKRTDSATGGGWVVWHKDFGTNHDAMFLNSTAAVDSGDTNYWNDTAPTSSVYSVKDNSGIHNASGGTYLTYCFARTPGLIGIGSYTGNGNTDGPYVVVDDGASGFRPAWLMIKRTDTTGSWIVKNIASDPYNPMEAYLQADTSDIENTSPTSLVLDGTANGFKIRHAGGLNGSGGTFIYLAFADHPFGGEGVEQARAR